MSYLLAHVVFILFLPLIVASSHVETATTASTLHTLKMPIGASPRSPSARALSILKRQNTCGAGYCGAQDVCCGGSGCCPGSASCCSNGSCCEVGTLCTRDSQGLIGCCPVGQTCAGSLAGDGEIPNTATPSSTSNSTSPTSSSSVAAPQSTSLVLAVPTAASQDANGALASSETASNSTSGGVASPTSTKKDIGAGPIVGAVIGGILGWLALCAGFIWFQRRRKRSNASTGARASSGQQFQGIGLGSGAGSGLGAARPYTTLLERDVLAEKIEPFAGPMPRDDNVI